MKRAQLAINSVSTTQKGLEEALAAYAGAGFTNVEFVLPLVKDWLAQGHTVEDARALLAQYKLTPIGGFQTHVECFKRADEAQANHELFVENARLIDALGGGTLVFGTDGPGAPALDALETIAGVLGELVKRLEGLNVAVALEFNWSPVVKSLRSAYEVVKKVNHPQLGILFDPAHYYTTVTKFEDLTEEAVAQIKHVHINDMQDKPGEHSNCNSDRVLPGQGVLDLRAIIGRLEQYGYSGYYSIEMFNDELWGLSAAEAAKQCYESLLPYCEG